MFFFAFLNILAHGYYTHDQKHNSGLSFLLHHFETYTIKYAECWCLEDVGWREKNTYIQIHLAMEQQGTWSKTKKKQELIEKLLKQQVLCNYKICKGLNKSFKSMGNTITPKILLLHQKLTTVFVATNHDIRLNNERPKYIKATIHWDKDDSINKDSCLIGRGGYRGNYNYYKNEVLKSLKIPAYYFNGFFENFEKKQLSYVNCPSVFFRAEKEKYDAARKHGWLNMFQRMQFMENRLRILEDKLMGSDGEEEEEAESRKFEEEVHERLAWLDKENLAKKKSKPAFRIHYYRQVLGDFTRDHGCDELRTRFRHLSLRFHPDKNRNTAHQKPESVRDVNPTSSSL